MRSMIYLNLFRDSKMCNDVIEHKNGGCMFMILEGGHVFDPFCEIVYYHYDLLVTYNQS